jgi:hypothetical protein
MVVLEVSSGAEGTVRARGRWERGSEREEGISERIAAAQRRKGTHSTKQKPQGVLLFLSSPMMIRLTSPTRLNSS